MSEKAKRGKNFTDREATVLMSIISKHKNIIENKKTDGTTNVQKFEAWQKVTNAFNASCPESIPRSMESIRKWWDNKKRIIRKEKGDERVAVLLTGGGPPPSKGNPHSDLVLSIIDPETVVGGEGPFGSDAQAVHVQANTTDDYFVYDLQQPIDAVMHYPRSEPGCSGMQKITPKASWKDHCMGDLMQPKNRALKRPLEKENRTDNPGLVLEELQEELCSSHNVSATTSASPAKEKQHEIILTSRDSGENAQIKPLTKNSTPTTNHKRPLNRRRPNATVVRSLASQELAEKYSILADKKTAIADLTLKNMLEEAEFNKKAQKLRMEALELDVLIKKIKMEALQKQNN